MASNAARRLYDRIEYINRSLEEIDAADELVGLLLAITGSSVEDHAAVKMVAHDPDQAHDARRVALLWLQNAGYLPVDPSKSTINIWA